MVQVLASMFEPYFSEYSYGFRPKRSCQQAIIKALEYLNENIVVNPSPEIVISMYEDYIRELNILIANKENHSNNDKKYIESNEFYKIQEVIEENSFFDGAYIYKIIYKDNKVEIEIIYDEIE